MQNTPFSTALSSLSMPLRDIARAVRAASQSSEPLLKPATEMLPKPIQHLVDASIKRADEFGHRVLDPSVPTDADISAAQGSVLAENATLDQQAHLVRVLSYAMTESFSALGEGDWIISEMRLALIVAHSLKTAASMTSIDNTLATLAMEINRSTTVARHPNRSAASAQNDKNSMRIAASAPLVWLSLERDDQSDEAHLLHLCIDVARHVQDDLGAAFNTPADLAALIKRLSSII